MQAAITQRDHDALIKNKIDQDNNIHVPNSREKRTECKLQLHRNIFRVGQMA